MKIDVPKPGKYVIAVSGGIDSVVLLHILSQQTGIELIVAHFDHGIRPDSAKDRRFVQRLAGDYGLPFVYEEGQLGPKASEARARSARYVFLRRVMKAQDAKAIITAHHQDDVLETAIINILRGTGRKGLTALASRKDVIRPLLNVSKKELSDYAIRHHLDWREDVTNLDESYLRNYVRHNIVTRMTNKQRQDFLSIINDTRETNKQLDELLTKISGKRIDRRWFNSLPHEVAREIMAAWLRSFAVNDFDSKTLERLVVAAKTAAPGKKVDVLRGVFLIIKSDFLALEAPER